MSNLVRLRLQVCKGLFSFLSGGGSSSSLLLGIMQLLLQRALQLLCSSTGVATFLQHHKRSMLSSFQYPNVCFSSKTSSLHWESRLRNAWEHYYAFLHREDVSALIGCKLPLDASCQCTPVDCCLCMWLRHRQARKPCHDTAC